MGMNFGEETGRYVFNALSSYGEANRNWNQ